MRERDRGDQRQHHEREIFRRAEFQGDGRERRRGGGDDECGDRAGNERPDRRCRESRPGAALARHLVAVDGRDGRGRLAGQVDEDGGGRSTILSAVIDAGEHDQRGYRIKRVGDRQEHGDGRRRPQPRQHADQRAEQRADKAVHQVGGLERRAEPETEIVDELHLNSPTRQPASRNRKAGSASRAPVEHGDAEDSQAGAQRYAPAHSDMRWLANEVMKAMIASEGTSPGPESARRTKSAPAR